jgi:hypothetical protein
MDDYRCVNQDLTQLPLGPHEHFSSDLIQAEV